MRLVVSLNYLRAALCSSFFILVFAFGCAKKDAEGYRVVAFDAATGQYTIIHTGTFNGARLTKRLTVVCALYKWGEHEAVDGPEACSLRVGDLLVPNPLPAPDKRAEFLDVWEMSADRLAITQGSGAERIEQQFHILKEEVVNAHE